MAQIHKHEKVFEINSSAEDFCKIFSSEAYRLPNFTDKFTSVELVSGDWSSNDSVNSNVLDVALRPLYLRTCTDGKAESLKARTQVDKANKTLVITTLDGDVLRNLKAWKATFQFTPKNETASYVKLILEYEKINEDAHEPHEYIKFVEGFAKEVGDNLSKAKA